MHNRPKLTVPNLTLSRKSRKSENRNTIKEYRSVANTRRVSNNRRSRLGGRGTATSKLIPAGSQIDTWGGDGGGQQSCGV